MKQIVFLLFFLPLGLLAQNNSVESDSTLIEIISTQKLKGIDSIGLKILRGNVVLKQGNSTFHCDSAYLFEGRKDLEAFGNVLIQQGDSIEIESQYLDYDGAKRKATLFQDVLLTDRVTVITADSMDYWMDSKRAIIKSDVFITDEKVQVWADEVDYFSSQKKAYLTGDTRLEDQQVTITADEMDYDFNEEQGDYRGNGTVTNNSTLLTSETGFYDAVTKDVRFTESVHVDDPEYQLDTDTLLYNTITEIATFNGESKVINQTNTIYSNGGRYDKVSNLIILDESPVLENGSQYLEADSLFFDKETGVGYASGDIFWKDTSENITITGHYMEYFEDTEYVLATDSVLMQQIIDGDTLFLTADTIVSVRVDSAKSFKAHRNVRIYKSDFQAVCDSFHYDFADSVFYFFDDPVLWSDDSQLSGDTIVMRTENNNPKNIRMWPNALVGQKGYEKIYDQLAGKEIYGFFENKELNKISIKGAAESIYYALNDREEYYGVNESQASNMVILLEDREVQMIKMYENPKATFHPIADVDPLGFKLNGFQWREEERPTSPESLFEMVERPKRDSREEAQTYPENTEDADPSSRGSSPTKGTGTLDDAPRDPTKRGGADKSRDPTKRGGRP